MTNDLFKEFDPVASKQWKQLIQYDLKEADYNETLIWESPEGIKVKPFYHNDEFDNNVNIATQVSHFKILQRIYVFDIQKSNNRAKETLNRGAESIYFTVENPEIDLKVLFDGLPQNITYYLKPLFLSEAFAVAVNAFSKVNNYTIHLLQDPIYQLAADGNWFINLESDLSVLNVINTKSEIPFLSVNLGLYQNAGANIVQQLAYTLAHINEYFNRVENINIPITIEVAVGANYFFEIAKLRALRWVFVTLKKE